METNNFILSDLGIFAPPISALPIFALPLIGRMRPSGPDDDTKTLMTPKDKSLSEDKASEEAPQDGGSGPDDDTKTQ